MRQDHAHAPATQHDRRAGCFFCFFFSDFYSIYRSWGTESWTMKADQSHLSYEKEPFLFKFLILLWGFRISIKGLWMMTLWHWESHQTHRELSMSGIGETIGCGRHACKPLPSLQRRSRWIPVFMMRWWVWIAVSVHKILIGLDSMRGGL